MQTLTFAQARVLGVLIEKQYTTPDQFPLTLNSCTNACNQKTNRDPVCQLEEQEVAIALEQLQYLHLALRYQTAGSRTEKYAPNLGAQFNLNDNAVCILSTLMLRGPQTPGELNTRLKRALPHLTYDILMEELEALKKLDEPLVQCLSRRPGQKEDRWCTLFLEVNEEPSFPAPVTAQNDDHDLKLEVEQLKEEVQGLKMEIQNIKSQLGIT